MTHNAIYVSVAIPTYKRSAYLFDALQSVITQSTNFSYEILVLDNACDRTLQAQVEQIATQATVPIRYLSVPEIGLHNGRNLGAIEAKGEIVVYVDDDIIAPPGWLVALCTPFQDATVGGVGGKSVPQWEATLPDWLVEMPPSYWSLLDLGEDVVEMHFPDTPHGCNMAYRRHLVLELGGFAPDGIGRNQIEWRRGDGETGFAQKVYSEKDKIFYTGEGWLYHRIPKERMTLPSVRSQATKGAISAFYTQMRTNRYNIIILALKMLKSTSKFLWFGSNSLLRRYQPMRSWIKYDIQAIHYGMTALYQLRLLGDRHLRQWVYQEDYWPSRE